MKILPDYEHMEYRDVYTCRTYLTPCSTLWLLLSLHGRSRAGGLARFPPRPLLPCSAAAVAGCAERKPRLSVYGLGFHSSFCGLGQYCRS